MTKRLLVFLIFLLSFLPLKSSGHDITDQSLQIVDKTVPVEIQREGLELNFVFVAWEGYSYDIWIWRKGFFETGWERRYSNIYGKPGKNIQKIYYIDLDSNEFKDNDVVLVNIILRKKT